MALKEQIVPIPLGGSPEEGGGLREGVDSKLVNAPYLLDLQNGELGKDGSVRRRRPADQMLQTGLSDRALQNLNSVFVHEGGTLVVNTATGPHTFNDDTGWATTGELGQVPCRVEERVVANAPGYFCDSAISLGFVGCVFTDSDGIYFSATVESTGAVACPKTRILSGTYYNAKIFAQPTTGLFNLLVMDAASNANLTMIQISYSNFPNASVGLSLGIMSNVDQYDVAVGTAGFLYVAAGISGGSIRVTRYVESTYATSGTQTDATAGGSDGIGVWMSPTNSLVYVAAFDKNVDATHALTRFVGANLPSALTAGSPIPIEPTTYAEVECYGFVAAFCQDQGAGGTDVFVACSVICLHDEAAGGTGARQDDATFGQHGWTGGFSFDFSMSLQDTTRPAWNYYLVTKGWNPTGSGTSRPLFGLMWLDTASSSHGRYAVSSPNESYYEFYSVSIQSTVLVCTYGAMRHADSEGYSLRLVPVARANNNAACVPEPFGFTYDAAHSPLPRYYSRLAWVSDAAGSQVHAWMRPTYVSYALTYPDNSITPGIRTSGLHGVFGSAQLVTFAWETSPIRSAGVTSLTMSAAGYVGSFDGAACAEATPHSHPEYLLRGSLTHGSTPVGWTLEETSMCTVWRWTDSAGIVHRSAPQVRAASNFRPPSGTPVLNFPFSLVVSDAPLSAMFDSSELYLDLYVSGQADVDDSLHLVQSFKYDVSSSTPRDPEWPWMLNVDIELDSLNDTGGNPYDTGELVYTTGGVLEAEAPPAPLDAVSTSDRVWMITSNEVWPSKALEPGIAPEFNGNLVIPMLTGSGPCVAIAALDEKVIVFKASSIFVITGDGPNNTGGGNAFPVPQAVSTDIGCVSRASVVRGPFGLAFQSARGLYLLDRGLNLTWIGKSVEDTVGTDPVVCGVVVPEQSHVRWILDATGKAVVWNYDMNQWGVYGGSKELHGVPYQGAWVGLLDGLVLPDTTTAYFAQEFVPTTNDSGNYVQYPMPLTFTTAWVKPGSIQGFVRCRRALLLGEVGTIPGFFNAHNGLQIEAQYNYDPTTLTTYSWTPDETHVTWPNFECHLQYQRFESIRFVVSEVPIDGQLTCPGVAFSGMTLRVAVKGVPFKYFRQGDVR